MLMICQTNYIAIMVCCQSVLAWIFTENCRKIRMNGEISERTYEDFNGGIFISEEISKKGFFIVGKYIIISLMQLFLIKEKPLCGTG